MKKFLLVSLLCTLAVPTLAKTENLTLEQRIEKLEQIIEEQNKELKKQKLNIKKNEKKLSLATKEKPKNDDTELQFHGYLRTGAEGNMKHGNKSSYSKNKEYVGRWGNEYDTNFNINFSKKFIQNNGAWTKLAVQLESWSDNYDNTVGDESKVDLTQLYVEMGKVPIIKAKVGIKATNDFATAGGTFSGILITIFFLINQLYISTDIIEEIIAPNSPALPVYINGIASTVLFINETLKGVSIIKVISASATDDRQSTLFFSASL